MSKLYFHLQDAIVDSSAIKTLLTLLSTTEAHSYTVLYIGFWLNFIWHTHGNYDDSATFICISYDSGLFLFSAFGSWNVQDFTENLSGLAQPYADLIRAQFATRESSGPALFSSSEMRNFGKRWTSSTLQEGSCTIAQFMCMWRVVFWINPCMNFTIQRMYVFWCKLTSRNNARISHLSRRLNVGADNICIILGSVSTQYLCSHFIIFIWWAAIVIAFYAPPIFTSINTVRKVYAVSWIKRWDRILSLDQQMSRISYSSLLREYDIYSPRNKKIIG